jgi:Predicted integral membrane protein
MILSFKVVMENKLVMFVWALTIGAFLTLGLVTLGFAMILIMPLLGYASWHAFNQLIEFDNA